MNAHETKLCIKPNFALKFCAIIFLFFMAFTSISLPSATNLFNEPLKSTVQLAQSQTTQKGITTFSHSDAFAISDNNASISFASGGSYENATLENDTWHFEGLALNSYILNLSARGAPPGGIVTGRDVLPYLNDNGAFSLSAKDCNVTIIAYEPLSSYYPYSGWLNYSIVGAGQQTFDLHFPSKNFAWNITIDGEFKVQNEGWSSSNGDLIKIEGAKNIVSIYYDSIGIPRDLGVENPFPWLPVTIVVVLVTGFGSLIIFIKKYKRN